MHREMCMNVELDFEKRYRLVREVIETIVLTILMFLVIRLAVQNFNIEGMSMEPSLHDKELILVDKWTYLFHAPSRGDVVVFVAPTHSDQDYIKRIVALPGDTITIHDTTVIVDGATLNETYVDPHHQGNVYAYKTISNMIIPPNDYFVLGDNRIGSSDSRDWGVLPRSNIIGRAALVYWPLGQSNNGLLPNDIATWQHSPITRIRASNAIVAQHKIVVWRDDHVGNGFVGVDIALVMRINIGLVQCNAIHDHGGIMDGDCITREGNDALDIILIRMCRRYKNYDVTTRRCMKKIGPLINKDQFLIMEAGLHTHPFYIEILYRQADHQKHQDGKDDSFNYLPY